MPEMEREEVVQGWREGGREGRGVGGRQVGREGFKKGEGGR